MQEIITDGKTIRRYIKVILTPNGVQLATKRTATRASRLNKRYGLARPLTPNSLAAYHA